MFVHVKQKEGLSQQIHQIKWWIIPVEIIPVPGSGTITHILVE